MFYKKEFDLIYIFKKKNLFVLCFQKRIRFVFFKKESLFEFYKKRIQFVFSKKEFICLNLFFNESLFFKKKNQ